MTLDKFTFYTLGVFIGFCDIGASIVSVGLLVSEGIIAIPLIAVLFVVFLILTTVWIDYYNDEYFMDFLNHK